MGERILVSAAVFVCAMGPTAFGGDLNPPAGPIAPTPGPEPRIAINATNTPGDADSIFKITAPGSYYLTGNVTGEAGKSGIEIAASGVTVDLMGFDLVGIVGSGDGVRTSVASLLNIEVRNGSVREWGGSGVNLYLVGAPHSRVESVRASGNGGLGIGVSTGSAVSGCEVSSNTNAGIVGTSQCRITECIAYDNGSDGIIASNGTTVAACNASQNDGNGISVGTSGIVEKCTTYTNGLSGINVGIGGVVSGCSARLNTIDGIRVSSACLVSGNSCTSNGNSGGDGAGIHVVGADCRIENNNCVTADRGIDVDLSGNVIVRNTCSGNTIDWDIVANNVYGPIIDRRAPASGAVSGFSAASTLGSTDANANFSY